MLTLKANVGKTVHFFRRFQHTQAKLQSTVPKNAPVYKNWPQFGEKIALRDNIGKYSYINLYSSALELSQQIAALVDGRKGERIMFLCPNDANYLITLWAIWMSGQIAVPLSPHHPKNILLYYANDSNAKLLISTPDYAELMQKIAKNTHSTLHVLDEKLKLNTIENNTKKNQFNDVEFIENDSALIIYTSGTTGNPKGVVLTHKNLSAQVQTLVRAWKWHESDVILHTLPLHHIHGIVNALLCPLYVGAKAVMLPKFDANTVWSHLLGLNVAPSVANERKITVFMAVPTIYAKLVEEYNKMFGNDEKMIEYVRNNLKTRLRLMVSGSAPLPPPLYEKWYSISGHKLLERYGMTETGMILSNEYDSDRSAGFVGVPLPGVGVKIVENDKILLECENRDGAVVFLGEKPKENVAGDLLVRGEGVFKEYYNRPQATAQEFQGAWFSTGDMCEYDAQSAKFKMLGRKSADIIKTGGYKISALQIETEILAHRDVMECIVVGVMDEQWGEKICAIIVPKNKQEFNVENVREFLLEKLPKYAQPRIYKIVDGLPKNAMGKVNKKQVVKSIFNC